MKLQIQTLIGTIIASSTLTIRIGDDLKHEAPGVSRLLRPRPHRGGDGLMARLTAELSAAFLRNLKKKAMRRNWSLVEPQKLINLVLDNTPESMDALKRRRNMHRPSGA